MPKNSREQIDADEKKVIRELQKNSKGSIDKIAKRCSFSRQKVWRIIKRLEKNKTIWGYYAVVDNEKLDMKRYIMLIKRSNKPIRDAVNKIIDLTMHCKREEIDVDVICSSYIHGHYDWMLIFTANNIKNAKNIITLGGSTISQLFFIDNSKSKWFCLRAKRYISEFETKLHIPITSRFDWTYIDSIDNIITNSQLQYILNNLNSIKI